MVAIAAVILLVIVVLIALGDLVLPGTPAPAPVTIQQVNFTILQGTNSTGANWFGPSHFSYSPVNHTLGYPFQVKAGGGFSIPVVLENFDNATHTIYSVTAGAPFTFITSKPLLPSSLMPLQDSAVLDMNFTAPNSPGSTLVLFVTLDALPPG